MRAARQGETAQRADADPELLFSYFLGQFLFDVPDDATGVFSALRGHSLARSMYGYNPGGNNTTPFNGPGRLHYQAALGGLGQVDNYNLVNYQYFGTDGFLRDPERYGSRGNPQGAPGPYVGGANVPYTYPDANNMFLAAVRASDGTLLTQSYHRRWLFNPTQALNDSTNPNWTNAAGKYSILRPRPADHSPAFPFPEDGGGDVCNRPDLAGYQDPVTSLTYRNDSLWIDLGFPVMRGPDGRKYKPLFAPLVDDLDNRVNVNVNGNLRGSTTGAAGGLDPQNGISLSDQGFGPWEVNLQRSPDRYGRQQLRGTPDFHRQRQRQWAVRPQLLGLRLASTSIPVLHPRLLLQPYQLRCQLPFDGRLAARLRRCSDAMLPQLFGQL